MDSIEYIKALLEYAASYCKAVDEVARERKYLASTRGFPEDSTINFVRNIVNNNLAQYYAVSKGKVIGWCDILPKSNFEGLTHVGTLGMGILSEYRHHGIGTKLIDLTLDHAKKYNRIEKVELEVYKSNINAISFYKKLGFMTEGERTKARKLDGCYDNNVLMGKEI